MVTLVMGPSYLLAKPSKDLDLNSVYFDISLQDQHKQPPRDHHFSSFLEYETHSYLSPLKGTPISKTDYLKAQINGTFNTGPRGYWGVNLAGATAININSSYFYVQEIYWHKSFQNWDLDVGRKLSNWAEFDEDWNLGLWQPLGNIDPLRPFHQGLVGAFFSSKQSQAWSWLIFASPLFMPTFGPEIAEKDGALVAQSRWHKTPVTSGLVLDKQMQFNYKLDMPELAALVQQVSAGASISYNRHGQLGRGPWFNLAVAHKPLNQLSVKYDYDLAVSSVFSQAEVTVVPSISYHDVLTIESGIHFSDAKLTLSFFGDQTSTPLPTNMLDSDGEPASDWISQSPEPIFGGAVKWNDSWALKSGRTFNYELGYLQINHTPSMDKDSKGVNRGSLLPYRFSWNHAFKSKISMLSTLFGKSIHSHFLWMREFEQKGTLLSVGSSLQVNKQLGVFVAADILGVDDISGANTDPGFFNQFRTNDRVSGGVSYVF